MGAIGCLVPLDVEMGFLRLRIAPMAIFCHDDAAMDTPPPGAYAITVMTV